MLVLEERGKPEYPEKNLSEQSREEDQQTHPTYDAEPRNRTRATLVGGECSDTAPTLLPQKTDLSEACSETSARQPPRLGQILVRRITDPHTPNTNTMPKYRETRNTAIQKYVPGNPPRNSCVSSSVFMERLTTSSHLTYRLKFRCAFVLLYKIVGLLLCVIDVVGRPLIMQA